MLKEVKCNMSSCTICAMSTHTAPRPLSPLVIDLDMELLKSQGNTAIMIVVNRFSKSIKLFPLLDLSTVFQTAEFVFQHVFWHFVHPRRHCELLWAPIHILCLGRVHGEAGGLHEPHLWLSPTSQQPSGASKPKGGSISQILLCLQPGGLVLLWAEYSQNSLRHAATQVMPFQCVLGHKPP